MVDFRFFINRTGPRGPQGLQGEKGDPGNTFTVSEGVNTPTEYTLIFDGGDGNQFETDNLRNPIVDRGGTYVRYDRDNVVQYIGEPDMAVIDGTPGIVNLAGKDTVTPNASDAVAYELLEKTVDELNTALENLDGRLDDAEGDLTQAQLDIVGLDNRVTTNEGNITSLQSGKADKSTTYTKTEVNSALAGKANTVHTHTISQITNAGALASQNTVDYQTQVTNKPTIPTVGNGTITFKQGNTIIGTITTNQLTNSTLTFADPTGLTPGTGLDLDSTTNTLSVKIDNDTLGINSDGEIEVQNAGTTYSEGNAIDLTNDTISVKYDNSTLKLNGSGELYADIPGAATSSTLGLVQPDNTTIAVDANGVISANIPTPETVDQTYDASSTHAQSGVAIAGAGFMNGSIVQSPLQYLPDTTDSLTYQNVNTSTMIGSGKGISASYNGSSMYCVVGTESGTENFMTYTGDKADLISNSSLTWFETELANGINFSCSRFANNNANTLFYILGHYENNKFTPDAIFGNPSTPVYLYIISTDTTYYMVYPSGNGFPSYSYYLSGTSLTGSGNGWNGAKGTKTIIQADADILNEVTHIRIYVNEYSNSTLAFSDIKVINPTSATPVTDGDATARQAIFDNGTNIFDAHPESLSLKYDNTTLGVNSSGQLYAQSSAPSNMVTTDTAQTINNDKTFSGTYSLYFGSSYPYRIYNNSGTLTIKKQSSSYTSNISESTIQTNYNNSLIANLSSNSSQPGISNYYMASSGYNGYDVGVIKSGSNYYNQITTYNKAGTVDPKIYRNVVTNDSVALGTNFLVEKDMLDGTTIQYNDTSGKVEVIGGGGGGTDLKQYSNEFTIEGSLVNTNGVLSSFSDLNYGKIPSKYFAVGNSIRVKFNFVTKSTARQYVLAGEGFLNVDINTSSTTLRTWNNTTSQNDNITTLTSGQDYYLRIDLKDTGKDFYVTQDPSNWGTAATVADTVYTSVTPPNEVITIGLNTAKTGSYWNSTIDSNYIEIYDSDGVLIYKIDDNDQIATEQRLGLIKPDNQTVKVDEYGTISVNISDGVGTSLSPNGNLNLIVSDCEYTIGTTLNESTTVTENNGLITASHPYDYSSGSLTTHPYDGILIPKKVITNKDDFEIVMKMEFQGGVSTGWNSSLIVNLIGLPGICEFGYQNTSNIGDTILAYSLTGGTTFTYDSSVNIEGLQDKPKYWRIKRENTTLIFSYSNDGINYTPLFTDFFFNNTDDLSGDISIIGGLTNSNSSGGLGKIYATLDLKESYIKCDGKLTWGLYGTNGIAKATDTTYGLVTKNHPMPGDIYYPVTVGASGAEYTATDTGWFVLAFTASANNQYLEVQRQLDYMGYGNPFYTNIWRTQTYGSTSNGMVTLIPVKKGDTIKVNYNTGGSNMMIFVPSVS